MANLAPSQTPLPWIFEASRASSLDDNRLLKLAREVAMDIKPISDVLQMHELTPEDWDFVSEMPRFQSLLRMCVQEWSTATNTKERVTLKALAMVEEGLPEFYARMHDPKEALAAKVEVLKTVAKFAGVGNSVVSGSGSDRLVVTINLGEDRKLRIERDITPQGNEDGGDDE